MHSSSSRGMEEPTKPVYVRVELKAQSREFAPLVHTRALRLCGRPRCLLARPLEGTQIPSPLMWSGAGFCIAFGVAGSRCQATPIASNA